MPDISVVIPSYQAERHIRAAVESALGQTRKPAEILVVDDSTDGTAAIVRSFGGVVRLIPGPRQGLLAARNLGWQESRGVWIQFLDADDVLYPEKFGRQLAALESNGADVALCQNHDLFEDGRVEPGFFHYPPLAPGEDAFLYLNRWFVQTCNPVIRRTLLERVGGFRPEVRRGEEGDLLARLAAADARFVLVDEYLYAIRHHDGPERSTNQALAVFANKRKPAPEALEHRLDILLSLFELLEADARYRWTPARAEAVASKILQTSIYNWRDGAVDSARKGFAFLRGKGLHPPYGERRWYKMLARVAGHERVERLLDVARRWRGK
jgi:glycosyltransferase involved in cell wall biosynthesis